MLHNEILLFEQGKRFHLFITKKKGANESLDTGERLRNNLKRTLNWNAATHPETRASDDKVKGVAAKGSLFTLLHNISTLLK